jgi:hypothetical protein
MLAEVFSFIFSVFDPHNLYTLDQFVGTGYLTACFALMVGPNGRAVGVEHIPELVSFSIKNIEKSAAAPLLKDGSLSVHECGTVYIIFVDLKNLNLYTSCTTIVLFPLIYFTMISTRALGNSPLKTMYQERRTKPFK